VRAALYARVSPSEVKGPQSLDCQLNELKRFANSRGYEVSPLYIYVDGVSEAEHHHPQLDQMMGDARQRKFDTIIIARLSQIMRSLTNLLSIMEDLDSWGINLICVDQRIEISPASGGTIIHILGALAEFERGLIRDGCLNYTARGGGRRIHSGRPRRGYEANGGKFPVRREDIEQILSQEPNISKKRLAARLGIPRSTLYDYLSRFNISIDARKGGGSGCIGKHEENEGVENNDNFRHETTTSFTYLGQGSGMQRDVVTGARAKSSRTCRSYSLPSDVVNLIDQLNLITGRPKSDIVANAIRVVCMIRIYAPWILKTFMSRYLRH